MNILKYCLPPAGDWSKLWVGPHEGVTSLFPEEQQSRREDRVQKCQAVKIEIEEIKIKRADFLFV